MRRGAEEEAHIAALISGLSARGLLKDAMWRRGLAEVPRHLFAPPAGLASPDATDDPRRVIDRAADPEDWWQAVYSDTAIITQVADGTVELAHGLDVAPPEGGGFTSSLSAPGLAVSFLDLLAPRDHDRVLEIGTGTGWTAGLLSWRLGADNITSIEVDEQVAGQAAKNLASAGYAPRLIVGDGAAGAMDGAPYTRRASPVAGYPRTDCRPQPVTRGGGPGAVSPGRSVSGPAAFPAGGSPAAPP